MEIDSGSEEDLSVKGRLHTVPSAADTTPSPEKTDEQVPDEARVVAQEGPGAISVTNGAQRGAGAEKISPPCTQVTNPTQMDQRTQEINRVPDPNARTIRARPGIHSDSSESEELYNRSKHDPMHARRSSGYQTELLGVEHARSQERKTRAMW